MTAHELSLDCSMLELDRATVARLLTRQGLLYGAPSPGIPDQLQALLASYDAAIARLAADHKALFEDDYCTLKEIAP